MTIIFSDEFDAGFTDNNGLPALDPSKWLELTDGTELLQDDGSWEFDPIGQIGAGFASTVGYGLVFKGGSGAVRQATTTSLSTITRGGTISFNMIFGNDNNGGEEPDQLDGISEGIYLSYSIDGGNTYTDIVHYLTTSDLNNGTTPDATYPSDATPHPYASTPVKWTTFTVPIPTLAIGEKDVRFKWQQKKYSTTKEHLDSWGIDNVSIELTNDAPSLKSPTAGSISETAGSSDTTTSGLSGTLIASDDNDDVLTYGIKGGTITGSKSLLKGNFGTLTVSSLTGNYVYTPNADAVGAINPGETVYDSFTVTVTDGSASDTGTYTVKITGTNESDSSDDLQAFSLYIQSKLNKIKATASLALSADTLSKSALAALVKNKISVSSKALTMSQSLEHDQPESILHCELASIAPNLNLAGSNGKRSAAKKFLYYNIDDQGAVLAFNYNPITRTGARLYDTDGDGIGDFLSIAYRDGNTGDNDAQTNGSLSLKTTAATVELTAAFTAQDNSLLTLADPNDSTTAAALNLQASLTSNSNAAHSVGYIILSAEESADADTILTDIDQLKSRAVSLFSTLEATDVTLNDAFLLTRSLQLLNGQSIRFFSTADSFLSDLSSLSDSRFSWLDHSINPDGTVAVTGKNNIGFSLSQQDSDPGLAALIAQHQHIAPSLDFTAFTTGQTISGTIHTAREASFDSITGFYRTVDTSGTVLAADGSLIAPGEDGYKAAALLDSNRVTALDNLNLADNQTKDKSFSLTEFSHLAPYAQVNGNTFFAFATANADGLSHFQVLGDNLFGLEDTLGGGDLDYDDLLMGFSFNALNT